MFSLLRHEGWWSSTTPLVPRGDRFSFHRHPWFTVAITDISWSTYQNVSRHCKPELEEERRELLLGGTTLPSHGVGAALQSLQGCSPEPFEVESWYRNPCRQGSFTALLPALHRDGGGQPLWDRCQNRVFRHPPATSCTPAPLCRSCCCPHASP